MDTLGEKTYGGRDIKTYAANPGLAAQIISINKNEDIFVFGTCFPFSVRDIIDTAKINTEQRGSIIIEQQGNVWNVYVVGEKGQVTNGKKKKVTVQDIEAYKMQSGSTITVMETSAHALSVVGSDDGNNGQFY